MQRCPHCQTTERPVKGRFNRTGSQRFQCQFCRRQYTPAPRPPGYDDNTTEMALKLYLDGNGFRRIGRLLSVNHQSVVTWINMDHAKLPTKTAVVPESVSTLEMEELFTFGGAKKSGQLASRSVTDKRAASPAHTVCYERTPEVRPAVIDAAPPAQHYVSEAFTTSRELCWWGTHQAMDDKSETYAVAADTGRVTSLRGSLGKKVTLLFKVHRGAPARR